MEKVFVVTYVEHENGGRAIDEIIGVFDNKEAACRALDECFHKACDKYGVQELGEYDYQNEDSFSIEDGDDCTYEAYGEVQDVPVTRSQEKKIDLDDMYIVPKDFANFYIEDTQQWCGTHEAAVFTKEQAEALVKSERDKFNLHGTHGPYAVKLVPIQKQLKEE